MNEVDVTRDHSVPYFLSEGLGLCSAGVICHSGRGRGTACDAIRLGVDHPMEFISGETLLTQYP
jgi:hypothetical protein